MYRIVLFALILSQTVFGQPQDTILTLKSATDHIMAQRMILPQEKIYVQTDKPYYITGEKIFFRAFLLDAASNQPAEISRYVYVELINPVDSVVLRQQIHPDEKNALFYGALTLPEYLPQGDYRIRAYTRFMENMGEACFYSQFVYIADPNGVRTAVEPSFNFLESGKTGVTLRFRNAATKEILIPQRVYVRLNREKRILLKLDDDGSAGVTFRLPKEAGERTILVECVHEKTLFGQYLRIPVSEPKAAISFYPEGGNLIAGQLNKIAFEALLPDGNAAEMKGGVFNSHGEKVAEFATQHEGMGMFTLSANQGEHYYANCDTGKETIKVEFPEPKENTLALTTIWRRNRLSIALCKPDGMPQQKLYLIAHCRGVVFYSGEWNWTKDFISIYKNQMPSGVSHFLLLTEDFQPVSERLVFTNNDNHVTATVQVQEKHYNRREKVEMDIQLQNIVSDTLCGNFSVSVTDDRDVVIDTTSNILSYILLTSDIKGSVSHATSYLNPQMESAADLLMMTHGWNRYHVSEAIRGDFRVPEIDSEVSQRVSGIVQSGLLSKPYKGAAVSLSSVGIGFYDVTESDENGRFEFNGFEFPDSTGYMLQALTSKGKDWLELKVDKEDYPEVTTSIFPRKEERKQKMDNPDFLEYVSKADKQYTTENGMRIEYIEEVIIRGHYMDKNKYTNTYGITPDYVISEKDLEKVSNPDLRFLLINKFSRITMENGILLIPSLKWTSFNFPPYLVFIIDGNRFEYRPGFDRSMADFQKETLGMINLSDVVQINLITGPKRNFYNAPGGMIEIITKGHAMANGEYKENFSKLKFNTVQVNRLGYQQPVEFYSPQYDTPSAIDNSKPDLRSTIYWKPDVIADTDGKTSLTFYTADSPSTYSVMIEGVMPDGKLIYQLGKAVIEVE